jgi:nucleoside 2-deoxyribosyltransferase
MRLPVYIASKLPHAERWRTLRQEWRQFGIDINSRWIDAAHLELENKDPINAEQPVDYRVWWTLDVEDVLAASALIVYAEKTDVLRGALVETGVAIAAGKFVVAVGEDDDSNFGTWHHHPFVYKVRTLEHAKRLIVRRFNLSQ